MSRNTTKILSMLLVLLMIVSALSVVSISAADSTIISSLSATVTEPVAGKLPNYEVVNTVTNATLRQVFWWEKDEDGSYTEVALDETFVAGKIYSCDIGYQANGEGVFFADDITGAVNGKEASVFLNETKTSATLIIEFVCAEAQPELSVIFTKDSKAKCGSSLTVDIEAMAELSEDLMNAYFDDTVTYQWFMDGTKLDGATDVSLALTDDHCSHTITVEVAYGEKVIASEGQLVSHFDFVIGHIMDLENPVSDTATCTEDGEVTYKCKDAGCDVTTTKFSPAKGHSFGDWYETTEPDCVNDGEKERECINCGELETEVVPAYGSHTDDDEDRICDVCGNTLGGFVNPDSSYDEATKDEATKDESITDEATKDEATKDEATKDESTTDEATKDESTTDEATKDEATKDEATKDEQKPSTDDEQKPSTDDEQKPSTDDEQKPSTDDEPKPSDPVVDKGILGDVNGDGKVNIKDATMIQKFAAKIIDLTDAEQIRADVNADGKENIKDATAIQKFVAKIETGLPIGEKIG